MESLFPVKTSQRELYGLLHITGTPDVCMALCHFLLAEGASAGVELSPGRTPQQALHPVCTEPAVSKWARWLHFPNVRPSLESTVKQLCWVKGSGEG